MAQLNAKPQLVNSKGYTPAKGFTRAMIQAERRSSGVISFDRKVLSGLPPVGDDLAGNAMIGTAVLVDYNYVLCCAHTFDSLLGAVGTSPMASGKVSVVFNNEYTAETADADVKEMEPSRPTANLRGDQEFWIGDECGLDYALVKIEWRNNGFGLIRRMPTLPDPDTFHDVDLAKKNVLFVGQFATSAKVFSTHVALSPVTKTGVSVSARGCGKPTPPAYGEFSLKVDRAGPSGSGVYDIQSGRVRLVGIFGKGISDAQRYFVPLDKIYADTVTAKGSAKPPGTIGDLMRKICKQRWKDGMPKI